MQRERRGPENDSHSFVEEEEVVDEHEATSLCNSGEEAAQDPGGHEGLERLGRRTPDRGSQSDGKEPEEDRQPTKERSDGNDDDTTSTEHEDIADCRVIDGIWSQAPHAIATSAKDAQRRLGRTYVACGSNVTAPTALP